MSCWKSSILRLELLNTIRPWAQVLERNMLNVWESKTSKKHTYPDKQLVLFVMIMSHDSFVSFQPHDSGTSVEYAQKNRKATDSTATFQTIRSTFHTFAPAILPALAMRSKTVHQVEALASRVQRWRQDFPWLQISNHGVVCTICRDAGVQSSWGRGHGPSA